MTVILFGVDSTMSLLRKVTVAKKHRRKQNFVWLPFSFPYRKGNNGRVVKKKPNEILWTQEQTTALDFSEQAQRLNKKTKKQRRNKIW